MMWLVFLAAPIVLKNTGHVAIDNLPRMLPQRLKYMLYVVVFTAVLFLLYEFVIHGWGLALNAWPQMTTSIPISYFWVYLSVPVGSAIMIVIMAEQWLRAFVGIFDPDSGSLPSYDDVEAHQAIEAKMSGE